MYIKGVTMTKHKKPAGRAPDTAESALRQQVAEAATLSHDVLYDFHVGDRVTDLRLVSMRHYTRGLTEESSLLWAYLTQDYAGDISLFVQRFNEGLFDDCVLTGEIDGYRAAFLLAPDCEVYSRYKQYSLLAYTSLVIPVVRHDNMVMDIVYGADIAPHCAVVDLHHAEPVYDCSEHHGTMYS